MKFTLSPHEVWVMWEKWRKNIIIHISHSVDFIFPWASHAHIYLHAFGFAFLCFRNAFLSS